MHGGEAPPEVQLLETVQASALMWQGSRTLAVNHTQLAQAAHVT